MSLFVTKDRGPKLSSHPCHSAHTIHAKFLPNPWATMYELVILDQLEAYIEIIEYLSYLRSVSAKFHPLLDSLAWS